MKPDYKKLYEYVCNIYSHTEHFYYGQWDETFFTVRVFETCKDLIKKTKLKVNEEVILTASIFHDIGKTKLDTEEKIEKDWDNHPFFGAELTREILRKEKFENSFIEEVANLVKHHDNRPGTVEMIRTNELKILQDADLLADMGIASFIRPFLYSGKNKKRTIENINFIRVTENTFNFPKDYLHKFNLRTSKHLAKKLMKESQKLNEKVIELTRSELLE